jgi:hypothetical protein
VPREKWLYISYTPIFQPYTTRDLVAQNTIFGDKVLIAQQFLIDGPRDIRQQVFPVHRLSLSFCCLY